MILITGANGNSGRCVAEALAARQMPFRVALRPGGRGALPAGASGSVDFDFADQSTWAATLDGVQGVYLLRPPAIANIKATLAPFINAVRAAGAGPIVFLSVAGAERNPILPHAAVERHLRAGPSDDHTILRPTYFAQNLEDAFRADIRERGEIVLPSGAGRVAFVDLKDVGEVAALALSGRADLRGVGVTLTGPRAVTFSEVAGLIATAAGRPMRYEPVSPLTYALRLRRQGQPAMQILVQTILNTGLRFGQSEAVDPTLPRLLGRPATDIADYIRRRAEVWRT